MEKTDEELMVEYQRGSRGAIEVIFLRYQKLILNFSLRFLGNRADAEDVTSEVFLGIVSGKSGYIPQSAAKFSTWLYTVARNACLSKIRRRKNVFSLFSKMPASGEEEEWDVPDTNTPADELHKKEVEHQVKKAVQQLSLPQREVFVLREFHGLSYDDIAQSTGHSLANVKVLLFRAREELRKKLGALLREA